MNTRLQDLKGYSRNLAGEGAENIYAVPLFSSLATHVLLLLFRPPQLAHHSPPLGAVSSRSVRLFDKTSSRGCTEERDSSGARLLQQTQSLRCPGSRLAALRRRLLGLSSRVFCGQILKVCTSRNKPERIASCQNELATPPLGNAESSFLPSRSSTFCLELPLEDCTEAMHGSQVRIARS